MCITPRDLKSLDRNTVSVTRLRTVIFRKKRVCMSEQSLFRRFAPYKSLHPGHLAVLSVKST